MTLAEGTKLGRYQIVARIGAGGMGEVYRALDTTLDRTVAIKMLRPELVADAHAVKRLIREAKAAAALDHPNICSVYEVGQEKGVSFIVMQYVDGMNLGHLLRRGPVEHREILDIAVQIAQALAEAHSRGVIHRDIKPQNIMVTSRGLAKLMDFGIAKTIAPRDENVNEYSQETLLTGPGIVLGTLPYMSPEQVKGEELDPRSDLFSLGVVLYELITRRCPFAAPTSAEIITAILSVQPPPLASFGGAVPGGLQQIVSCLLEKQKEHRYQSANDLLGELKVFTEGLEFETRIESIPNGSLPEVVLDPVTAPPSAPRSRKRRTKKLIRSLAVLPLMNASGAADMDYLSDGITETIINKLAILPKLRVMARATVFRYKGQNVDPQQVGRDLSVGAVLTGRVLQMSERLLISTELVDAEDGSHIWGEQFNRTSADIFDVQQEIAQRVSEALQIKLSGEDKKKIEKRFTANTDAYQLYLKGLFQMNKGTVEGALKGIEFYNKAIELDPLYALAYSGLANAFIWLAHLVMHPRDGMPKAKAAALKAIELDESVVEAHIVLGLIKQEYDIDWLGAESEFERALELDPNHSAVRRLYGFHLTSAGRFDEALAQYEKARELDPLSLLASAETGWCYYQSRRYDQAIDFFSNTLALDQYFYMASWGLGSAYVMKGEFGKGAAEFERMLAATGGQGWELISGLAHCHAVAGNRPEAKVMLDQLIEQSGQHYVAPLYIAQVYTGLGENDKAIEWLEKSFADRVGWTVTVKWGKAWDSLRMDPRFQDLARRIGP
jgi:serine/threonine-protein kinase